MRSLTKAILFVLVMGGAFAAAYLLVLPLLATFLLALAGEPSTNYELYETFKNSLPAFGVAVLVGVTVAFGAGSLLDRLLKGVPWFNRGSGEPAAIELTFCVVNTDEKEEESEVVLFSQAVSADDLDALMHDLTRKTSLAVAGPDGKQVLLGSPPSSPYEDEEENPLFASIRVVFKQRKRVLYSFETVLPGQFYSPEGKDYSKCVYALRHVGIEEESRARIVFKGPRSVMRDLFMR